MLALVSSSCLEEDIVWRASRSLRPAVIINLVRGDWLRHGHNVLLTRAAVCGETWLPCALGQQAARLGFSVLYAGAPRLPQEPHVAYGDVSLDKRLARLELLILDDFGNAPIAAHERNDLLDLLDDRVVALDAHHQPVPVNGLARPAGRAHSGRRHPGPHRARLAQDSPRGRVDAQAHQGRVRRPRRPPFHANDGHFGHDLSVS